MRRLFGTDGIRGVANVYPMTADLALKLGRALVVLLSRKVKSPKIIVAKDTRKSGYMLETALCSGIVSMGGEVFLLGPLPTASVAYLIREQKAQGGIMISASHNPYQDNGLKIFDEEGFKLDDALELELEDLILNEDAHEEMRPLPSQIGKAHRIEDAPGRYLSNLKSRLGRSFDLRGIKIVFDGANGAAYSIGPKIFKELGAEVIEIATDPDGTNINRGTTLENPSFLKEKVLSEKADMGFAVDGDADRLLMMDEEGTMISGEHLLYALAVQLKSKGRLAEGLCVTTLMSNQALEKALKSQYIKMERTDVGDRYVTARLKESGAVFGGENSGHYLFLDQNTTGDALFSALEVLEILIEQKKKASDLQKSFVLYPQKLLSVRVKSKPPLDQIVELQKGIQKVEERLAGEGRINIRYSGTEAVLRIMIEGPELRQVEEDVNYLAGIVEQELGA